MKRVLEKAHALGASDLHLVVGMSPFVRVNGEILLLDEPPLSVEAARALIYGTMTEVQVAHFESQWELCFSRQDAKLGFYRTTVYYHRGAVEAAVRLGHPSVPPWAELGLPDSLAELTRRPSGLILITGPTGAGKTTTMNALIDLVNRERRAKIVTIEDPVEYVHESRRSIVVQQEVGMDTHSYQRALIHVLRQDPDVIAIGEMRSLETINAVLTAADTGHLVVATLHSNDCPQTINRIVDVFPDTQQNQVRHQLASVLHGIINQRLLPRVDRKARVLVYSLLAASSGVRALIRENKVAQLVSAMQSGKRDGMVLMEDMVRDFYQRAVISFDTASDLADVAPRMRSGAPPVRASGD